jgi:hypothetical protein
MQKFQRVNSNISVASSVPDEKLPGMDDTSILDDYFKENEFYPPAARVPFPSQADSEDLWALDQKNDDNLTSAGQCVK